MSVEVKVETNEMEAIKKEKKSFSSNAVTAICMWGTGNMRRQTIASSRLHLSRSWLSQDS